LLGTSGLNPASVNEQVSIEDGIPSKVH
jgi:hypothetical protein